MTIKSKRTLVSLVASIILLVIYISYAMKHEEGDMKALAIRILIFIGIAIGSIIIINILFHIIHAVGTATMESIKGKDDKEVERIIENAVVEDEMDRVISLRAGRVGYSIGGVGLILALVLLALGYSNVIFIHVLVGSFFFGTFVEGCTTIYYYEKGV